MRSVGCLPAFFEFGCKFGFFFCELPLSFKEFLLIYKKNPKASKIEKPDRVLLIRALLSLEN